MNHEEIPIDALEQDARLESEASKANMDLYRHRWHWTLNPDNPHRVSLTAYATAVGRSLTTVRMHARGYAAWLEDPDRPLREHIDRVNMSTQRQVVFDAISRVFNISFASARSEEYRLAAEIEQAARVKVESKGVTFEEAVDEAVQWHYNAEVARKKERKKLQESHGMRYVAIENEITKARNAIHKALNTSHDVPFTTQEREILAESIRKLSSVLSLLDLSITGTVEVDWDEELRKLGVA